jgi:hypothetical protein
MKIFGYFILSTFILKRVHQICKFLTFYFFVYSLMTSCREAYMSLEFIPVKYKLCSTIYQSFILYLFNPLNAELNPICHLLVLLGDLTFMGTCIVSTFQYTLRVYPTRCNVTQFIHIWKLLYIFRVVLPPIIRSVYNRFECAVGGLRHPQHTQTSSNSSTIAADSSNVVTNTRCCRYSCMHS